jgi:predicted GIY-YIG superfamily endonuclease
MGYGLGLRILSAEAARVAGKIEQHISDRGGSLSAWYAGITDDPERRLFTEHNVSKQTGHWVYRKCSTDDIAREVEQHFLGKGCKGGPGGGKRAAKYVYAYKVTNSTVE